ATRPVPCLPRGRPGAPGGKAARLSSGPGAWGRRTAPGRPGVAARQRPFGAPARQLPPPFEPEPPALPAPVAEPLQAGWEERLGGRAFLWIGAITLALAAIFLVRYSIEEGWLSPEVRVILAAAFGFVLIGVAEPVRGRDE